MARKSANHQPSLLDWEPPLVTPCPANMIEMQGLLAVLMGEIGETFVAIESRESNDEQDNG
jgi:hypothetical protein